MNDRKLKWVLIWGSMFFVYVVLSTFNLLLSNYYYQGNEIVRVVGGFTDLGTLNFIWTPGWLLGFILGTSFGDTGTFLGQVILFLIGVIVILRLFNISFRELANKFDNFVKRGP